MNWACCHLWGCFRGTFPEPSASFRDWDFQVGAVMLVLEYLVFTLNTVMFVLQYYVGLLLLLTGEIAVSRPLATRQQNLVCCCHKTFRDFARWRSAFSRETGNGGWAKWGWLRSHVEASTCETFTCLCEKPSCASSSLSHLTHLRKIAPHFTH